MVNLWLIMVNHIVPIGSMVLVYLSTKLGHIYGANVGKYSIHGSYGIYIYNPMVIIDSSYYMNIP